MNREIKFRAWNNVNKSWLTDNESVYLNEEGSAFILVPSVSSDYLSKVDVFIMQFTGLKDKNGKEIYEGDIVITNEAIMTGESYSRVGSIGYREDIASFVFIEQDGEWDSIEIVDTIIGNLYENPELLK